jgi:DNA-binding transcriptional MocR family regulator
VRKRLCKFNGVAVPEQVAIVSGVQEALDLTARLLLNPGVECALRTPDTVARSRRFRHSARGFALLRWTMRE